MALKAFCTDGMNIETFSCSYFYLSLSFIVFRQYFMYFFFSREEFSKATILCKLWKIRKKRKIMIT